MHVIKKRCRPIRSLNLTYVISKMVDKGGAHEMNVTKTTTEVKEVYFSKKSWFYKQDMCQALVTRARKYFFHGHELVSAFYVGDEGQKVTNVLWPIYKNDFTWLIRSMAWSSMFTKNTGSNLRVSSLPCHTRPWPLATESPFFSFERANHFHMFGMFDLM